VSVPPLGLLLRALQPGVKRWVRVRGSSMWPLLVSGDEVQFERGAAVGPGDAAVLLRGDGALVTHVVSGVEPLRTCGFLGPEDAPGLELLGAVRRVRRGPVEAPYVRALVWPLHLAAAAAQGSTLARAAWHVAVSTLFGPGTGSLRRPALGVSVRTLDRTELEHFAIGLSHFETLSPAHLERLLTHGRVSFAESRLGVAGTLVRTEGGVLAHAHLAAWARHLGLEERLVGSLDVPELVTSAEVPTREVGFVEALRAHGFREHDFTPRTVTLKR